MLSLSVVVGCSPTTEFVNATNAFDAANINVKRSAPAATVKTVTPSTSPTAATTPTPPPTPAPTPTPIPWTGPKLDPDKQVVPDVQGLNPDTYFVSQQYDPNWNPFASPSNGNCGPTSFYMACKALGVTIPGATEGINPEYGITAARLLLTGKNDPTEFTYMSQLIAGANALGLHENRLVGQSTVINSSLSGHYVLLFGDPGSYCFRLTDEQYYRGTGAHIILVTSATGPNDTDYAYINDPLSKIGNIRITILELRQYMATNNWNQGLELAK